MSRFARAALDDFHQHLLNEVVVVIGERIGFIAHYVVVEVERHRIIAAVLGEVVHRDFDFYVLI